MEDFSDYDITQTKTFAQSDASVTVVLLISAVCVSIVLVFFFFNYRAIFYPPMPDLETTRIVPRDGTRHISFENQATVIEYQ